MERSMILWLVVVGIGAGLGYGYYLLLSWGDDTDFDSDREVTRLREWYGVSATGRQLELLRDAGRNRKRAGAVWGGIALGAALPATFWLPGDGAPRVVGVVMVMASVAGSALGHSWAALRSPHFAETDAATGAAVRYPAEGTVTRTELAGEIVVAAAGWAALLVGVRALAVDGGTLGTDAAVVVAAAGALAALTATAALLMQRRLVRVFVPVDDVDAAVVLRILAGSAARELISATLSTVAIAMVLMVMVPGTWWPLGVGGVAVFVALLVGGRIWQSRTRVRLSSS